MMSLRRTGSFHGKEDEEQTTVTTLNPLFKPRAALLELLFSPDYEVVSVLGEVILIPEEGKTFVEAIVDFFQAHNHLENLLEWAIAKEINSTSSISTLFRGACEATKLMPVLYTRLGSEYLRSLVGPLVKDICSSQQSFEIDPNKAERGVDVRDNLKKVLSLTTEFLDHIYESVDRCPNFLRYIFAFAKKEVTKKFPQASSIIVGVFFFLRFMIPAIVTPTHYGLLPEPPSAEAQRGLVIISKLLQNLSNGIEFDESDRYLSDLNRFLHEKMESLQTFFNKLADPKVHETAFVVTSDQEYNALLTIVSTLKEHKDKIYTSLIKPETKRVFLQVLSEVDKSHISVTPKRKKLERVQKQLSDEKDESFSKLEGLLAIEMKMRKLLENKVQALEEQVQLQLSLMESKFEGKLSELLVKNEQQEKQIAMLEGIISRMQKREERSRSASQETTNQ